MKDIADNLGWIALAIAVAGWWISSSIDGFAEVYERVNTEEAEQEEDSSP